MFIATPENDADVTALVAVLRATSIGETATYAQMTAAIGRPVEPRRYLIKRAIDRLNAEIGAVFVNVHKVGYKRLPIESVATVGVHARRAIRRKASRTLKHLGRASSRTNDVPQHVALQLNRERATLGIIMLAAEERVATEVEKHSTPQAPMPIAKVAERLIAALR